MILSADERKQFKFLLPIQGDLKTIETVSGILDKLQFKEHGEEELNVEFSKIEMQLIMICIEALDEQKKIHLQSFPLIKKILANNEVSL